MLPWLWILLLLRSRPRITKSEERQVSGEGPEQEIKEGEIRNGLVTQSWGEVQNQEKSGEISEYDRWILFYELLYSCLGTYVVIQLAAEDYPIQYSSGYVLSVERETIKLLSFIPYYWGGYPIRVPVHITIPIDKITAITHLNRRSG